MGLFDKLKKKKIDKDANDKKAPVSKQQPAEESDEFGSEYTDDESERVHSFEIGQEDYLVQVALATSAQDYQQQAANGTVAAAAPGASEVSWKYWRDERWAAAAEPGVQAAYNHPLRYGIAAAAVQCSSQPTQLHTQARLQRHGMRWLL